MAASRTRRRALSSKDLNEMGARRSYPIKSSQMSGIENVMVHTEKHILLSESPLAKSTVTLAPRECTELRPNVATSRNIWVFRVWGFHFLLAFVILALGIASNHKSRKYVPINPTLAGEECVRAYLDVMAASETEPLAIVCCANATSSVGPSPEVCSSKSDSFPLANRLSKFPEAWLLPLFPVLLRVLYWMHMMVTTNSSDPTFSVVSIGKTLKRILLYIALFSFRGWVLYLSLNQLEDHLTKHDSKITTSTCWYNDGWLQVGQEMCVGRAFDFSDHIVLYYAQILPVALFETIYSFQLPYWTSNDGTTVAQLVLPTMLLASHAYLQLITALGAYRTAAFFHSPGEVLAGFGVSLVIAAPLCLVHCSTNGRMAEWRSLFVVCP